jgi:hypothetical protein
MATLASLSHLKSITFHFKGINIYEKMPGKWPVLSSVTNLGIFIEGRRQTMQPDADELEFLARFPTTTAWISQDDWDVSEIRKRARDLGGFRPHTCDLVCEALDTFGPHIKVIQQVRARCRSMSQKRCWTLATDCSNLLERFGSRRSVGAGKITHEPARQTGSLSDLRRKFYWVPRSSFGLSIAGTVCWTSIKKIWPALTN